ncbi:hypothetical protein [Paraflavitalea speifideaquila]|uniref:hypothetical protein n=1 Tax=Paraflavitalea speifideaquila TaxID=3076558 RepID=UPI0028E541DA|nr:hypothetical protein [Paraflavitalea speifideiaquila]
MKVKIIYALLLLLCCTLGASSNRNTNSNCEALKNCTGSTVLPLDKSHSEAGSGETAIPGVTGYLPGYSIIFMN